MYFSICSPCCPRDYTAISLSSQQKCGSFAAALGVFAVSVLASSGSWHIIRSGRFRIRQIAVGKIEIILQSCVDNGEPSPVRSNHIVEEKSIIRLSKGYSFSYSAYIKGISSPSSEDVPCTSPTPLLHPHPEGREPTVHFHRTPYLAHKPASRPPSHRCGSPPLAYPDRTRQSPRPYV